MKHLFFILFSTFLIVSCSREKCGSDPSFENGFHNCVKIVQRFNEGAPVRALYRYEAIECLEAFTGYKSRINKEGDTPYFYNSEEDFLNKDLQAWKDWFEKNKCNVTLKTADSLIELHSKMTGQLHWPPDISVVEGDTLSY